MILVDPLQKYETPLRHKWWAHMVSDENEEELHAFAARLGLKRDWFQSKSSPHYDITATKRMLAVKLGAVEVTSRELAMHNYGGFFRRRQAATQLQQEACDRIDAAFDED